MIRSLLLLCLLMLSWASVPEAQVSRVVFLATVTGTGTDDDPFMASGFGTVANMQCIDLRKDPTVATGRMFCAADSLPAGGGINQIGDSFADNVAGARRTAIQSALGVTLTANNIIDVLAELLTTHASLDGTRWRPLRAGNDGKYRIYLGRSEAWEQTAWLWDEWRIRDHGLVADASNFISDLASPVVAWAASASENWNCSDSASLTCQITWTEDVGTGWGIVSNRASNTTVGSIQMAHATSPVSTDNHSVTATRVTHSGTGGGTFRCGVIGRKADNTTQTMYGFFGNQSSAGSNQHELYKWVNGTSTALATDPLDVANGVDLTVTMDGSSISGSVDGSLLIGPITDTSITGNLYGGIYANSNVSSITCVLDGWILTDIGGSVVGSTRRRAS